MTCHSLIPRKRDLVTGPELRPSHSANPLTMAKQPPLVWLTGVTVDALLCSISQASQLQNYYPFLTTPKPEAALDHLSPPINYLHVPNSLTSLLIPLTKKQLSLHGVQSLFLQQVAIKIILTTVVS